MRSAQSSPYAPKRQFRSEPVTRLRGRTRGRRTKADDTAHAGHGDAESPRAALHKELGDLGLL
ncbi:hypothetical protein QF032_007374 [Streptomyces achromogenes]|uniref:Uncharacterized protein n=1 Tax=Streptomyces achromogenes TaxID=67255 RepID=A0ABU0QCF3_STRAH|nr:hypothetical protein [Streptomyces achromogenes]MDQ0688334.1 hypothetical protein [Streptomyces achromogenes]MDQ0835530.1 hypothetical protein [Streptomyces achromogenes]